jgi:hypothetical protein
VIGSLKLTKNEKEEPAGEPAEIIEKDEIKK